MAHRQRDVRGLKVTRGDCDPGQQTGSELSLLPANPACMAGVLGSLPDSSPPARVRKRGTGLCAARGLQCCTRTIPEGGVKPVNPELRTVLEDCEYCPVLMPRILPDDVDADGLVRMGPKRPGAGSLIRSSR